MRKIIAFILLTSSLFLRCNTHKQAAAPPFKGGPSKSWAWNDSGKLQEKEYRNINPHNPTPKDSSKVEKENAHNYLDAFLSYIPENKNTKSFKKSRLYNELSKQEKKIINPPPLNEEEKKSLGKVIKWYFISLIPYAVVVILIAALFAYIFSSGVQLGCGGFILLLVLIYILLILANLANIVLGIICSVFFYKFLKMWRADENLKNIIGISAVIFCVFVYLAALYIQLYSNYASASLGAAGAIILILASLIYSVVSIVALGYIIYEISKFFKKKNKKKV